MSRILSVVIAGVAFALTPVAFAAGSSCSAALEATTAVCACAADQENVPWASHGRYLGCVKAATSRLVNTRAMTAACKTVVGRCAARSVCGRTGAVTCLSPAACFIAPSEQDCTDRGGTPSTAANCCEAS
jgi:hypothetical protein